MYDDGIRLGDEDEAAFQQAGGSASAFAGVFHVTVHKIDGFSDDAGFVVLQTGTKVRILTQLLVQKFKY